MLSIATDLILSLCLLIQYSSIPQLFQPVYFNKSRFFGHSLLLHSLATAWRSFQVLQTAHAVVHFSETTIFCEIRILQVSLILSIPRVPPPIVVAILLHKYPSPKHRTIHLGTMQTPQKKSGKKAFISVRFFFFARGNPCRKSTLLSLYEGFLHVCIHTYIHVHCTSTQRVRRLHYTSRPFMTMLLLNQ